MTEENAYDKEPEDDLLAKQQKFHAGISVYGPNMSEKFRGTKTVMGNLQFVSWCKNCTEKKQSGYRSRP